jgi:hypothetical protein
MPRIAPVSSENPPPDLAAAFKMDLDRDGVVLDTTRIAGHLPSVVLATKRLGQAVATSGHVPAQLRLLMNVRIARMVGCPF